MKLYILRHGHSPSVTEAKVPSDAQRPLSERGRANAAKSAEELSKRAAKPARLLHSPLLRAVETARIAAQRLSPRLGAEVFLPLSNELPADKLYDALRAPLESADELLVVGHQPQLGELAMFLTGHLLDLRPSGLIALDLPDLDKRGEVLWTFHPED